MRAFILSIFLALASSAFAQPNEVMVELEPLVVTEGVPGGAAEARAVKAVEAALAEKETDKNSPERSVIFDAKFWQYIPITLGSVDRSEFLGASYSTAAYRAQETRLRASEKLALLKE